MERSTYRWNFPERLWGGFGFGRTTVPGNESKRWSDWEGQDKAEGLHVQLKFLRFYFQLKSRQVLDSSICPEQQLRALPHPQDIIVT